MTTSSDKTRNKLLDSMRMSKETQGEAPAAAAKPAAADKPAANKAAAKKPAAKKPATKKAAPKKAAAKKAPAGSYSTREARAALIADTFESGKRIWPD